MSGGNGSLAPNANPSRVRFQTPGSRLSWRPVCLFGAIVVAVLGMIIYANHTRPAAPPRAEEDRHGAPASPPEEMRHAGGTIPRGKSASSPAPSAAPAPSPEASDEVAKARMQAYLAARNAGGSNDEEFAKFRPSPAPSVPKATVAMIEKDDPNNAREAIEAYRQALAPRPARNPEGTDADPDRWALHTTLQRPASPYVIEPGTLINATLETGINSELPGMIKARVSSTVYDSPTLQYPLIPAGSELIGQYSNKVIYGQNRLLFVWNRINFPDGTWLDIGAMPGVSDDGTSGGRDLVDTHFFRTFGQAALMSVITAGVTLSQPQYGYGPNSGVSASQALSESLGQNLGTASSMLFQKNLDVAPTLKLRPGYPFHVMVSRDIYLPGPYYTPDYTIHE